MCGEIIDMFKTVIKKRSNKVYLFSDENNGLEWQRYNPSFPRHYEGYNAIVNSWSEDPNINRYLNFDGPLSDTFVELQSEDGLDNEGYFYAFEGDRLAGIVYITTPLEQYEETSIEYIVVNPNMRKRGIATRMISSIKDNPTFFSENHQGAFVATVDHTNEGSKRAFMNNGFVVAPSKMHYNGFPSKFCRVYFIEERSMTN